MRIRRTLLASLLSLLFFVPTQLWGWGNTGHEAVAYIAWQQMSPAARARAVQLLKLVPTLQTPTGKSVPGYPDWVNDLPSGLSQDDQNLYLFMRAATWPDSIKHVGLHDSDVAPAGTTTEVNIGFSDTKSHGYWHFVDAAFASDDSPVPPTPAPNAATQIAALRTAIASGETDALESYDMIWLEHLVGDIHQPLHGTVRYFAGKGDEGGNTVKIKLPPSMEHQFEGTLSKSAPRELHAFWDDLPGEGDPGPALPNAAAFAQPLSAAPADKIADTDPNDWAAESLSIAQSDVYAAPIGKAPELTASNTVSVGSGKGSSGSSYVITQAYYDKAMNDAKERIALAGSRLAKLLNENLSSSNSAASPPEGKLIIGPDNETALASSKNTSSENQATLPENRNTALENKRERVDAFKKPVRLTSAQVLIFKNEVQSLEMQTKLARDLAQSSAKEARNEMKLRNIFEAATDDVASAEKAVLDQAEGSQVEAAKAFFDAILDHHAEVVREMSSEKSEIHGSQRLIRVGYSASSDASTDELILHTLTLTTAAFALVSKSGELTLPVEVISYPPQATVYYHLAGDEYHEYPDPTTATLHLHWGVWYFKVRLSGHESEEKEFNPYNNPNTAVMFTLTNK